MQRKNSKKLTGIIFLQVLILFFTVSFSGKVSSVPPEEFCRNFVLNNITEIVKSLNKSSQILEKKSRSPKKVKELIEEYAIARKFYKQIEFFVEYYSTFDAKYFINGPLVPKNEIEFGPKIYDPAGFQVIEENLFSEKKFNVDVLKAQFQMLTEKFTELKNYYSTITIERPNYQEALRLELIRIMCLTLNGYDCTINKATIKECVYAITSLSIHSNHFSSVISDKEKEPLLKLENAFKEITSYLNKHPDSDNFDRLYFITHYLDPSYDLLCSFFDQTKTGPSQVNYGVNFKIHSGFNINSINKQHFSLYRDDTLFMKQQADLGKLLFFDPILSGNNKRACASCHKPELAFTDGLDKSFAFDGEKKISRNSPTLLNASYQKLFFHDGRAFNLEEQAGEVFHNTFEMQSSAEEIVQKLKQSSEYVSLFRLAYKGTMDSSLTFYAVMRSIAEYIKTLESKNSKFDKYIKGDVTQLTANEKNGFNLFNGKALCGSCHFYPLFNGLVPPMYNDNEFEVIGTAKDSTNKELDTDIGREKITGSPIHKNAFKTPTVRNIALTAPYMHNGAYKTLDQILDFYNKGGGAGLKLNVSNQTLPFDSLGLSKVELNDIKAFLITLTDTSNTKAIPKKLPSFADPVLNKRRIGGEY